MPVAAYNVSGEYAALKAAAERGWIDERACGARDSDRDPARRRRRDRHLPRKGGGTLASGLTRAVPSFARATRAQPCRSTRPTSSCSTCCSRASRSSPHPFEAVATRCRADRGRGRWSAPSGCCDERIIREITPIFDTTALGYSSMLVAAKVDGEHPQRAAAVINEHPGVSHNYLRNHDFNLWFTIATAPDSKLGLDGTLDVLKERSGAESIRQLPTVTMFKINMNLEMEKRHRRAGRAGRGGRAAASRGRCRIDDFDVAVIRALQGPMEVRTDAYAPAADAARRPGRADAGAPRGHDRAQAPAARGRDPVPPPRRLLGQRHGRLEGARRTRSPRSGRAWRRCAASRTATAGRPTRTGPTASSRWRTVARRRSATRCSTGSAGVCGLGGDDRATLYSSTEYKKVRLHYFTPDYAEWEERSTEPRIATETAADTRSHELYARAQEVHPGRREQPGARDAARWAASRSSSGPARAPRSTDVDGNRYIDYVCSWGPLILGHAHPAVVEAVAGRRRARHELRRPDRGRGRAGRPRWSSACPSPRWCAWSPPAPRPR